MQVTDSLSASLATLRNASMAALVRERIEAEIIDGSLAGGMHLSEAWLSTRFEVSRGPIREALRTLEGQGLVEQRKNLGWFVRSLPPEEIAEVFAVRAMLDDGLARLLVERRGPARAAALDELSDLVVRMDEALARDRPSDYARLNQSFHDGLLALVGNGRLTRLYRNMMGELASRVTASLSEPGAMERSNQDHRDIVAALAADDVATLRSLFARHRIATSARMIAPTGEAPEAPSRAASGGRKEPV